MTDHTSHDAGATDTGAAAHHHMNWDHHHPHDHHHHHDHDHNHDHSGHHHHDPHGPALDDLRQYGRVYMPDYPVREARWQQDQNGGSDPCSGSFKWMLLILLLLMLAFVGGYNASRGA